MRDPSFDLEYDFLAERMIDFGNTWLYATGLYKKDLGVKHVDHQVNALLCLLYPYLTPKGQKELKALIPQLL